MKPIGSWFMADIVSYYFGHAVISHQDLAVIFFTSHPKARLLGFFYVPFPASTAFYRYPTCTHTHSTHACFPGISFMQHGVVWWTNFPDGLTNVSTTSYNSVTLSPQSFLHVEKFDSGSEGPGSKRSTEQNWIKSLGHLWCRFQTAICPSFESAVTVYHT